MFSISLTELSSITCAAPRVNAHFLAPIAIALSKKTNSLKKDSDKVRKSFYFIGLAKEQGKNLARCRRSPRCDK